MFTNIIFSDEKEAELFGKKSMKRGYEYKIVEYNKKIMIGIGTNEK